MSSKDIELGKRKVSSDEFKLICETPSIQLTINPATINSLEEKSSKRFAPVDLSQFKSNEDITSYTDCATEKEVRGVILMLIIALLQDRVPIRPVIVQYFINMLNSNNLPQLPSFKYIINEYTINTILLTYINNNIDNVYDIQPNNHESRFILQIPIVSQSIFILTSLISTQLSPLLDLSISLGLELTSMSMEPYQISHHNNAHPHQCAIETANVIRNITQQSQLANKYNEIINKNKDKQQQALVKKTYIVPESFSCVPDVHGVYKNASRDMWKASRVEIMSAPSLSSADEYYTGLQSMAYIFFYSEGISSIGLNIIQCIIDRISWIENNLDIIESTTSNTYKNIYIQNISPSVISLSDELISIRQEYNNNIGNNTNNISNVILASNIIKLLQQFVILETSIYTYILQYKGIEKYKLQIEQAQQKKILTLKKIEDFKAAGKADLAAKLEAGLAKTAINNESSLPTISSILNPGIGSSAYLDLILPVLPSLPQDTTQISFISLYNNISLLLLSYTPSFSLSINNIINISASIEVKLAKGARDITPDLMLIREKAFNTITTIFKQYGAGGIDTPVFERREVLTGKYGEDSKLIYDLADQGGELLSLRYDLTVPFARFCASNGITSIRRYHIGKVYRRDNPVPTKGRYREFYQCDFDIAGEGALMVNDSEVLSAMANILSRLPLGPFVIKLNHRGLLDAIMTICGVTSDKLRPVCSAIDKLDKETWETVKDEMCNEKGLPQEVADKLQRYVQLVPGPIPCVLDVLRQDSILMSNVDAQRAVHELSLLDTYITALGVSQYMSLDMSLARGLDYYTGLIYEAVLVAPSQSLTTTTTSTTSDDTPSTHFIAVGSIAAGGRYDKLVGMFSGKSVPAVGASIGIERVLTIIEQRAKLALQPGQKLKSAETIVLVAANTAGAPSTPESKSIDFLVERMKLASLLRSGGIATEYMPTNDPNMRKQMIYAENNHIPIIVWIGYDEIEKGIVSVKNVFSTDDCATGTSTTDEKRDLVSVPRDELISYIKQTIIQRGLE